MMTIREFFERDITRPINGVVKADQQDDSSVWQELDEFVVTRELDKHLHLFFSNYLAVADNLNKPEYAGKIGVWISGFFGSGKSHFLKVLSYLMSNRDLRVNGQHKRTAEFFENKVKDSMLYADIKRAVAVPTEVVLFNIETKSDHANNRDAILSVLLRMLNELQGYAGHPPHIAHMERNLDERGKLAAFEDAFLEASGKSWRTERDAFDFYRDEMVEALSKALGQSNEASAKWYDTAEANFSLTVENFCLWVKEYLDSKGPDHRLLFFADEVGAFIGQNSQLMLNLQTITETLGTTCGGRAWIIVTSQEDIDTVIGEMSRSRVNDFSRITARFTTRMSLSSANVDEVIRERLLAKREVASEFLSALYKEKGDIIRNQLTFGATKMSMKSYENAADFAATYPFIPYQFQLVQKIFEAIRKAGATGMHLARGERSLLDAFQSATSQINDCAPGVLVPLYRFYPSIENFLDTAVKLTIEQAAGNGALQSEDVRILEVLFLIRYVDEVKGNIDNLVALCMDKIDCDRLALRRGIESSLLRLENQNLVNRNGDDFSFFTNEEQDVKREIKSQELDSGAEAKLLGDLIYDEVLKEQRKHRYTANGKDFPFNRICDGHPHGNRAEGAIGVHSITPLNDDYNYYDQSRCTLESTTDGGQLVFKLADHESIAREARLYLQTERYIGRKSDGSQESSTQRILREFSEDNRLRRERLVVTVGSLVAGAEFYAGGQPFTPKASAPMAAFAEAMEYLIKNTFTKMVYLKHLVSEPLREIQAVLRTNDIGQQTLAIKADEGNPQAIQEVRDYLRLCTQTSKQVVLSELVEERFSNRPYGWPSFETILIVARLLVTGEIHLLRGGAKVPIDRAYDDLSTATKWKQIVVLQRKMPDPVELQKARKLGQDLFGAMGPDHEEQLFTHLQEQIKSWSDALNQFKPLADTGNYPGKQVIDSNLPLLGQLLAENDAYKFVQSFLSRKEDLLDLSDNFHELSNFFSKQRTLWDELRKAVERFQLNDLDLQQHPEAVTSMQRMKQILQASNPYKLISEVRGLIDKVDAINSALVSARRAKVLEVLAEKQTQTFAEIETAGNPNELRSKAAARFEALRNSAVKYDSVAHLDQAAHEASRIFEATITAVEEYASKPVPTQPIASPTSPAKPQQPAPKPRRVVHVANFLKKPFLETTDEVDDFLASLRSELLEGIAKSERIQLK
jgi:hypothetical protein